MLVEVTMSRLGMIFGTVGSKQLSPTCLKGSKVLRTTDRGLVLCFPDALVDLMRALSLSHCILLYCLFNGAILFCYSLSDGRVPDDVLSWKPGYWLAI